MDAEPVKLAETASAVEASFAGREYRERFIYAYKENSSHSTVDFVRRAIRYFGYAPALIQTDNGGEFTHTQKTDRVHPLDVLCRSLHIEHKTIRPRTPWHNGKVERSHRNDQERFYNHLKFYSYADLQLQMKRYLRRANRIRSEEHTSELQSPS